MEELAISHGLIIGKFLPPHLGHLHLIERALQQCDRLTILVCSLESEPISGTLRHNWMRQLVPNAEVIHVTDENPSYPHEHPDFWELWTATINRHVAEPVDVVFSSEDYGEELARRLGAAHVLIDRERSAFPISGTAIRENPQATSRYLPPLVRPFFVRRVVLTGSECTGKTTLTKALADHYRTVWVPEFGRSYVDQLSRALTSDDVDAIARGQIESEDRLILDANGLLIQDTDLISTAVYARHYFGVAPAWIDAAILARRADLYLLADIDVPWVADGLQRDRGDRREEMQALFREALRKYGATVVEVAGSLEQRMKTAIEAIDRAKMSS
jgi:NadR type nicotinamide-nucleotide adenylyltransferase